MERVDPHRLSKEWRELLDAATEARARAYARYSGFQVGAAVRTGDGQVYTGANIENAVYGLTACAERVAIWTAVADGQREIRALAVVTEPGATPCGPCRQVLREFAAADDVDLPVLVSSTSGAVWRTSLGELLPYAFSAVDLEQAGGAEDSEATQPQPQ